MRCLFQESEYKKTALPFPSPAVGRVPRTQTVSGFWFVQTFKQIIRNIDNTLLSRGQPSQNFGNSEHPVLILEAAFEDQPIGCPQEPAAQILIQLGLRDITRNWS